MTVGTDKYRDELTATPNQAVFAGSFPIDEASDVEAFHVTAANATAGAWDDARDRLTLNTDYSISNITSSGFTLTLNVAAADNDRVTLRSLKPIARTQDYSTSNGLEPDTVDEDFDDVIEMMKKHDEVLARVPALPISAQAMSQPTLPSPVVGKALIWGAGGVLVNGDIEADSAADVASDLATHEAASDPHGLGASIAAKNAKRTGLNTITGAYTFADGDESRTHKVTAAAVLTLPNSVFVAGDELFVFKTTADAVSIAAGAGMTITTNDYDSNEIAGVGQLIKLAFVSASEVVIGGAFPNLNQLGFPAVSGNGGKLVKVNSGGTAFEYDKGRPLYSSQSGTAYTLDADDENSFIDFSGQSGDATITIPSGVLAVGSVVAFTRHEASHALSIVAGASVTLNSPYTNDRVRAQYGTGFVRQISTDVWVLGGDME